MTRNEALLNALATMDGTSGSTSAVAARSTLPERTVRRGMHALAKQGLIWSPRRGLWQLTPEGRKLAAVLPSAVAPGFGPPDPAPRTMLEGLWSEGLSALFRNGTGR
jgi:hypothetical protein